MKPLRQFLRREPVLAVSLVLALISAFIVPPDRQYADYLDLRTLAILFSLMAVMVGFRRQGVFDRMGQALLARTGGTLPVVLVLVGLCFFGSMVMTNDVSLMTFVPFTFVVLGGLSGAEKRRLALPVVCMQTIAANLGSMLTPVGNPQNLYLYGRSDLSLVGFVRLMLPYTLVSLLLLVLWALLLCRGRRERLQPPPMPQQTAPGQPWRIALLSVLFLLCLLSVVHVLPWGVSLMAVLAALLLTDRAALRGVDYALLLTFAAFFVFIGNLGRMPAFSAWLQSILEGREVPVAVLASQVTSNVPAALLLSGFTDNTEALIIGTNLGGLGTLIASMASLISYRQAARELPQDKGAYFALFTLFNVIFLAVLMTVWFLIV